MNRDPICLTVPERLENECPSGFLKYSLQIQENHCVDLEGDKRPCLDPLLPKSQPFLEFIAAQHSPLSSLSTLGFVTNQLSFRNILGREGPAKLAKLAKPS